PLPADRTAQRQERTMVDLPRFVPACPTRPSQRRLVCAGAARVAPGPRGAALELGRGRRTTLLAAARLGAAAPSPSACRGRRQPGRRGWARDCSACGIGLARLL